MGQPPVNRSKGHAFNEQLADTLFVKSRRELYGQERKLGPVALDFSIDSNVVSHLELVQLIRSQIVAKLQEKQIHVADNGIPVRVRLWIHARHPYTLDRVLEEHDDFGHRLLVLFANVLNLHGEEWMTANRDPSVLCLPYELPQPGTRTFAQLVLVIVFRIMQLLDAEQNTVVFM